MMPNLFALLAGINNYHPNSDSNVSNLQGCKNDILNLQAFLNDRFPSDRRNILPLIDSDATYENVIRHFGDDLLLRAGKGDIVLFAYSGHGSREDAASQFDRYYPEGKEETLVLYDSRIPGGLDLADKELAFLIERVTLTGAHVAVLLDCCHSGSGTRAVEDFTLGAPRQTSNRVGARPFDSYLHGAFLKKEQGFYLPSSRHILLAACDRKEKAFELTSNSGLFSNQLLKTLEETGGQISYANLFARCRTNMSQVTDRQHPQFEPVGFFNAYEGFLGLGGASEGAPLQIHFEKERWQANMGAIHGLPVASGNPAEFEVLNKEGQVLGRARTRAVGMEASSLATLDFKINEKETYKARLTSLPVPKTAFALKGPSPQVEAAKLALKEFAPVYFDLREDAPHAAYHMEVDEEKIQLVRQADNVRLRTIEGNEWDKMFADAFEKLEEVAKWEKSLELDNKNTRIKRDDVELILTELDEDGKVQRKTTDPEVVIDILQANDREQKVPFRLEVRNKNSQKPRYCILFYASGNYGFLPMGYKEEILPNQTAIALERQDDGSPFNFELNGKNEDTDIFKLFVSNSPISGEALQQNGFRIGDTASFWKSKDVTRGGEEELRGPRAISGFGMDDGGKEEDVNDWYTITIKVKSVAREAGVGEKEVSLADNFVKIFPHSSFRAGVGMTSVNTGSRSIEPMSVVAELAKSTGAELLHFGETTRDIAPVNMLELTDIENEASLKENPLQLEIAANLQKKGDQDDMLLPLTFDGEHLLPIGEVERLENGDALVRISSLPDTVETRRRSLGKALKLCFLKLALNKKNIRHLQWVDYSGEKSERRSEGLKEKVKTAKNILLLIHGIIGDTKEMGESMRQAYDQGLVDLVLTFDYENLNTPIQETAGALEELLREEAGLSTDGGKRLSILAHSMGGLVARYFVENLSGNKVVKHLIMAGTPNAGSAIAKITTYRDYAIPLLTLLMNTPWGIPAAATALGILEKSKDLTFTLGQMDYEKDDFLKNLNKSSSPEIPYSIVAGNLYNYLKNNADHRKLVDKAFKLGGKLFYGDQPNDLAVSMESIKGVPSGRTPAPVTVDVDCHHLNYFVVKESMNELMNFLKITT